MKRPSSEFLTHKFEAYEGCTLGELAAVVLFAYALFAMGLIFLSCLGVNKYLCYLASVLGMYPMSKMAVHRLAKMKKDKPHGYFMKVLRLWLSQGIFSGLSRRTNYLRSPYVVREGRWSTVLMKKKDR